ncbi:hypothetical protein C5167_029254 [Papaver somniferum]|nr:hypothetical protein C5167_029254 [Papaver somniferum]
MATTGDNRVLKHPLVPQAKNEQLSIPIEEMIAKFDRSSEHLWRPYQELICMRRVHEKLHKTTEPSSYAPLMVSIEKVRQCYSETINLESKEFIEMMVVDGLFIIGIFQALTGPKLIDDKFLFRNIRGKNTLLWDLLLIENQIPIYVLEHLLNRISEKNSKGMTFREMALNSFKDHIELPRKLNNVTNLQQACLGEGNKHLLDLVAKSMHPDPHSNNEMHVIQINSSPFSLCTDMITVLKNALLQVLKIVIPSATELARAGVSFEIGCNDGSFLDVKFDNGVMKIPRLVVDVTLLRNQGIITHNLGSDDDVSNIFNKLCCDIYLKDDYYADIYNRVNIYYCDRWNFCKATLRSTYFDNPWADSREHVLILMHKRIRPCMITTSPNA